MATSSGNSSGSDRSRGGATYSPLVDGLVDDRKRKRMESNRESARRSRMRKQKHIDDLKAEVSRMKNDNDQIRATITVTTQRFVEIEAENSVLRAQLSELSQRLDSLNGILSSININVNCTTSQCVNGTSYQCVSGTNGLFECEFMENPWNMMYVNQQPIMASTADMLGY
ncbi:hypothetical protein L1987_53250 [Smallanthus sonchifolius]|uniref:Uncharacterized protein n=1 Tax=Smallanthus sonchifolius TaxID=185202 RepID=A0ACB9EV29_9ASTR|nr:hypothetical protein L1987_53250 [Smallanthus sonchifolius]